MKAIVVMFDSLHRKALAPYGAQVTQPGFSLLAEHTAVYDNCYAGSLPCMPARRELHTGRYNFLHRCWGPMEPFDDSMPQMLKEHGIHSHLVSDHAHYWEDGGCTYHTRYSTWEGFRGQEGDAWKGSVADPPIPPDALGRKKHSWRQDWVNREYLTRFTDMPMHKTFTAGLEFIEKNHTSDSWFLQIETFDPHEPYFIPDDPADPLRMEVRRGAEVSVRGTEDPEGSAGEPYTGPHLDWPSYGPANTYTPEMISHLRRQYASLVSRCDWYLEQLIEMMDLYDLWKDTMLIVCTDHGFLLGEHGWIGKNVMPTYDEIAHTPLFCYDPRNPAEAGTRQETLVRMIDIAPTLLDLFSIPIPSDMMGRPLRSLQQDPDPYALFGLHGGHINITDGRHVYMRAPVDPDDTRLYNYTLMPTHIYSLFTPAELRGMELVDPLDFTKGCKVLKIRALRPSHSTQQHTMGDLLFDLATDLDQRKNLIDTSPDIVTSLQRAMVGQMHAAAVPEEVFQRYGLVSAGEGDF